MKSQKGFIQIPLLIAIIAGVLVLGASYFGVKKYQNYQVQKEKTIIEQKQKERDEAKKQEDARNLEVAQLKQEVEILKEQKPQIITQEIIKTQEVIKEIPASNTKIETPQKEITEPSSTRIQNQTQTPNITEIVGNWRFFTAKVENADGSSWGSGLIIKSSDGTFKILTNKHAVEGGAVFNIKLPGNPIDNILRSSIISIGSEDFATISLGNSNEYLNNLIAGDAYKDICSENQKPILGDEILILGYPGAGSRTDVTITKGIISGFERGYFITDAKINPGNSGGVAINIKNNCYFGIPTYSNLTGFEALGRILDIWRVMGQF